MNNESSNFWFITLVIISIWFYRDHKKLNLEISSLQDEVASLEDEKTSYENALGEANSNIEDAQSYAWSSYNEMGDALDSLETVSP